MMKPRTISALAIIACVLAACSGAQPVTYQPSRADQLYAAQSHYLQSLKAADAQEAENEANILAQDSATYGRKVAYECRAQSEAVPGSNLRRSEVYKYCIGAHEPLGPTHR
jgi:hypothetical protein